MSFDDLLKEHDAFRQKLGELRIKNRATVFKALAKGCVSRVYVSFDGEGDSGQIHGVAAFLGKDVVKLPDTTVRMHRLSYGQAEPHVEECRLEQAIEALCYDALEEQYSGWEINDGAFGEFNFYVVTRSLKLTFNARVVDYTTTTNEL